MNVAKCHSFCGGSSLCAGLLSLLLAGCTMLSPRIPDKTPAVTVASPRVMAADQQALLNEIEQEGRQRLIKKHFLALKQRGKEVYGDNEVRLLIDGPATFDAMFADLEQARRQIIVESYIFEDSDIGRRVAGILLRKQAEGVVIHVMYDGVGSFDTPKAFFQQLTDAGIAVCEFNPVSGIRRKFGILNLNHRDHRKLLVVDEKIAFTGGINISSVYSLGSARTRKRMQAEHQNGWRDTHVRIEGPAVAELVAGFRSSWQRQRCAPEPQMTASPASLAQSEDRVVAVLNSRGDREGASRFYRVLLDAINNSSISVSLTMGYFVPDPAIVEALKAAAARGVVTELVLPGKSDSLLVLRAGQHRYQALLDAGVLIYEQHDSLLHAKTAVIDGVWSTIGSSNLDWRSFLHNDEVNVVILGREFGAEMDRLFAKDRSEANRVTPDAWKARGIDQRLMEKFGHFWEYWL